MKIYIGCAIGVLLVAQIKAAVDPSLNRRIDSAVSQDDVGVGFRDGITTSAGDVIVTRNGVSHLLEEELRLPNGIRISPEGDMTRANGTRVPLRTGQLLNFDGELETLGDPPRRSEPRSRRPPVRSRALGY